VDKITVARVGDSKPSFTLSVEAAATITVPAGGLVLAVGTNAAADNQQEIVSALEAAREKMREAQYPNGPLAVTYVTGNVPHSTLDAAANAAAIPALTEDDYVIAFDTGFFAGGSGTVIGNQFRRAAERYLELVLKAA
jgi:hypothetical protein